jgi:small subunit ribosomal protein S4
MLTGPRFKRARRLGAGIYDKTQTKKYSLKQEGPKFGDKKPRPKSQFGIQMLEKQKARFMYGVNERQFVRYVRESLAKKLSSADVELFISLETRLDNVVYRLGIAPTRQAARQFVSHGHILVNGKKITIPSYRVSTGEIISIREGSTKSPLFANISEKVKEKILPSWLTFDAEKKVATVIGAPKMIIRMLSDCCIL